VTPTDRAKARALCEGMAESRLIGECLGSDTINDALDLLPAALDDLDRLERGLEAINERTTTEDTLPYHGGPSLWEVVERLLAGREWNDDGTAPKGGTDG
jgi:hypothetical protein